jgi:hypothetical protein
MTWHVKMAAATPATLARHLNRNVILLRCADKASNCPSRQIVTGFFPNWLQQSSFWKTTSCIAAKINTSVAWELNIYCLWSRAVAPERTALTLILWKGRVQTSFLWSTIVSSTALLVTPSRQTQGPCLKLSNSRFLPCSSKFHYH